MSNMRSLIIGIFVIIVLIVGAIVLVRFLRSGKNSTSKPTEVVTSVTPDPSLGTVTNLDETNKSKVNGTAQIEKLDGQVRVRINLAKYPVDTLQSANIYMGTCDKPGSVLYPLAPTFNGQSVTTLETTIERLKGQKPLIIGVTKSENDHKLAACGSL